MNYRDKMNNVLKKHNIQPILIITTELSKTKNSSVFTVAENNTANQFIEIRKSWKNEFEFSIIYENNTWYEILIHEIETAIFNNFNDMKLFKNEIETFNKNVKLIKFFMWLIKSEKQKKFIIRSKSRSKQSKNLIKSKKINDCRKKF